MNRGKKSSRTKLNQRDFLSAIHAAIRIETCLIVLLLGVLPAIAQTQGQIRGTVVDKDGALVANVRVTLAQEGKPSIEAVSDGGGNFIFPSLTPGTFQLTFTLTGFAPQTKSGVLHAGEDCIVPQTVLVIAENEENIDVTLKPEQVAEGQIHDQEKQRLMGVIPNFYVSYDPHPAPLSSRQKFQLAWKSSIDPVSFGITAIIAGFEQADNVFAGYGQGAQGYGKRFGAAYADFVSGTFIGGAILPSLLKQDPRYFYKGTGSKKSRFFYAMANAVICKGDNGQWQPNYSSVIGDLASAGISNLYYPANDRFTAKLTLENGAIGIGANAFGNVVQEFLLRKITPHARDQEKVKP